MFTVILTHLNKGLSKLETQANHDPRKDAWTEREMEMGWEESQQMNNSWPECAVGWSPRSGGFKGLRHHIKIFSRDNPKP